MTEHDSKPKPGDIALPREPKDKEPWREPKLTFVEPVLTKEGGLTELTGDGFFGTFIIPLPTDSD